MATVLGVFEFLSGFAGGWWRAPAFLLRREKTGDSGIRPRHPPGPGDGFSPRLSRRRVAGVERGNLREVEGVIAGEPPNPVETPDVNGGQGRSVGERRFRSHGLVLSQSAVKHVKATIRSLRRS